MDIDIVIPYVDGSDLQWREGFEKILQLEQEKTKQDPSIEPHGIEEDKFRSFDTFRYLLRGIECCCPWIRRIYIVIQQPSQKPSWLKECGNLKIIYHKDIIPQEYLPTYNSATIEMFVWKIKGLSEHFIYINDDTFPINPLTKDMFFTKKGYPKINLWTKKQSIIEGHAQMLKNSEMAAIIASGNDCVWEPDVCLKDSHTWTPMKRSIWKILFEEVGDMIYSSLTTFRNSKNIVQQISTYYFWFVNKYKPAENINVKNCNFLECSVTDIMKYIIEHKYDIICINDFGVKDYESTKRAITNAFFAIFPNKSQFEI